MCALHTVLLLAAALCPAGKKVADFGSGLGVAGLAAALAGAKEVVLLDREPMALYCGLLSATATGIAGVTGTEEMQQLVEQEVNSSSNGGNSTQAVLLAQLLQQQKQKQQEQATAADGLAQQSDQDEAQQQQLADTPLQPAVTQCSYRALPFDWNISKVTERYDVVLACDVLYESEAVDLVASVIPKLLKRGNNSSLLLFADPPNRTVANRQRFLDLIAAAQPTRLLLQESGVEQCDVQQLDPEMLGGVTSESVSVQFMVFQSAVGNDTIGLKTL
jgi:predicted nicotinamide N-methyase